MTTVQDIYRFIDQVAPFAIQESWDNAGMLVGHWKRPVQKILVTLDITPEVVYEAEKVGADLIVAHHPILFHPAKQVTDGGMDLVGQRVLALAERGIAAICCHTNWDSAQAASITSWPSCAAWRSRQFWRSPAPTNRAYPTASAASAPCPCRWRWKTT